jgi:hypothetical protein
MKIGNCFTGLIPVMIKKRFKGKVILMAWYGKNPHVGYRVGNKVYHYRIVKRILPKFFQYIIFKGKYDVVNLGNLPPDAHIKVYKEP